MGVIWKGSAVAINEVGEREAAAVERAWRMEDGSEGGAWMTRVSCGGAKVGWSGRSGVVGVPVVREVSREERVEAGRRAEWGGQEVPKQGK